MDGVIFEGDGLVVSEIGTKFYVRYDVGTHQVVIREDEISEEEARRIMSGSAEASKVLFALQTRLTQAGINAYVSNITK